MRKTVQIEEITKKELPRVRLESTQINLLEKYLELLMKWNSKINLTAIREPRAIVVKHLLDSLVVFGLFKPTDINLRSSLSVLDMGSGAGVPGIILGIINPLLTVVSVDKSHKKIAFQNQVIRELCIENVKTVQNQLEDLATMSEYRARFDVIISRAFDQIKNILAIGTPFLKTDGFFLLWKGNQWQNELSDVKSEMIKNYKLCSTLKYQFGEFNHGGTILLIQKLY